MDRQHLSRRQFLSRSSVAVAAVGTRLSFPSIGRAKQKKEPEKGQRILGRTGLAVTQICFGGLQIGTPALLHAAIDRGINLIHLAPGYQRGKTMRIYGEVMKTRRDEVILALKQSPLEDIGPSLKALHTDYVDILMPGIHSVRGISDPRLLLAFSRLKQEGKIRFSGFAVHDNVPRVASLAIDLGFYDMMMPVYNLDCQEEMDPVLERAKREQRMGIMAMKTLKGVKRNRESVKRAFAKYLGNKNVDTLLVGMGSFDDLTVNVEACFQEYADASTGSFDQPVRVADLNECSACGACRICPKGVKVSDIMRFEYYLERGEPALAHECYARLLPNQRADRCRACGLCGTVCPKGMDIPARLRKVHAALTAYA